MSIAEVAARPDVSVAEALERLSREGRPGVCDTGRYLCRYVLWGDGPPIVFIHGISDVARSFAMIAADLCRDFTCILYELPTGEEDHAGMGGYRHAHFVNDLIALLDHLNLERTYIFASSFGATIALRALAEQPQRFARAVLQGAFARRPVHPRETILAQFARYWRGRMRSLPVRTSLKNPKESMVFDTAPPDRATFLQDNCGSAPISTVARIGLVISKLDLRPILRKIQKPIRLIGGDRDGIVPFALEQEVLAGLPNAERIEIPICGHVPHYTHSALLAELIRQFFTPDCHDTCDHHSNGRPEVSGNQGATTIPAR
jgi:pimeloyl-ACP methyl ester carboxylesterase